MAGALESVEGRSPAALLPALHALGSSPSRAAVLEAPHHRSLPSVVEKGVGPHPHKGALVAWAHLVGRSEGPHPAPRPVASHPRNHHPAAGRMEEFGWQWKADGL